MPLAKMLELTTFLCLRRRPRSSVYQSQDRKLTILQQRAPVAKGFHAEFTCDLVQWIDTCAFQRVLVMASADASYRVDSQIEGYNSSLAA